ncbi:hypothetical protein GALMADRAFT_223491 [Galerina marginata CBS 339.88]|uniref:Fe2OG dioxygenase domain-containing protein n=1 Tax=Galerina marginata (strain CBS 339.88) TaxID=685588 RepID=A0A067TA54_GALM3|nr:hypothetical protein GALMADRAFT_223491 [Galerina marginata CBS 339.88]
MGKNSKKRKNAPEKIAAVVKKVKHAPLPAAAFHVQNNDSDTPSPADNDTSLEKTALTSASATAGEMIGGLLYEDELETTTDTLRLLAQNPSLIGLKALKPFKTAVHDYWRVAHETTLTGTSLTSRISSALIDQRHVDALVLLSEMAIRGQVPKLGALQRWVRECDAVLTPVMSQDEENRVWQVLDAILRTTQPEMIAPARLGSGGKDEDEGELKAGTRLRWYKPFSVDPGFSTFQKTAPTPLRTESSSSPPSQDPSQVAHAASTLLTPLHTTPGPARRPPNKHPLTIYHSPPSTFPLIPSHLLPRPPTRHDLPGVPGAFIINDTFTSAECDALVLAAEKVGLAPDEPIAGSAAQLASVLAHNLVWLADEGFERELFARIEGLLPHSVSGGAVRGVNRRFRIYRYRPGALYRPHIDGAWPASSLGPSNPSDPSSPPTYIYDADPTTYSRLTLLIYLNGADAFSGGCTTFFLPSSTPGVLEARPVSPRKGTVCVFPHGKALGSLLHEGSGVTEGAKYVIRTEVLYEVDKAERVDAAI